MHACVKGTNLCKIPRQVPHPRTILVINASSLALPSICFPLLELDCLSRFFPPVSVGLQSGVEPLLRSMQLLFSSVQDAVAYFAGCYSSYFNIGVVVAAICTAIVCTNPISEYLVG